MTGLQQGWNDMVGGEYTKKNTDMFLFCMYRSYGITHMWGVRIIRRAHIVGGGEAVPFPIDRSPCIQSPSSTNLGGIRPKDPGTGFVYSSLFPVKLAHSRCLLSIC